MCLPPAQIDIDLTTYHCSAYGLTYTYIPSHLMCVSPSATHELDILQSDYRIWNWAGRDSDEPLIDYVYSLCYIQSDCRPFVLDADGDCVNSDGAQLDLTDLTPVEFGKENPRIAIGMTLSVDLSTMECSENAQVVGMFNMMTGHCILNNGATTLASDATFTNIAAYLTA